MQHNQPVHFSQARSNSQPAALTTLLCFVFLALLLRTAWLSDDGLITLRTVLNLTHGYGV